MRTARGNELESIHGAGKKKCIRWGGSQRLYGEEKGFLLHGVIAILGSQHLPLHCRLGQGWGNPADTCVTALQPLRHPLGHKGPRAFWKDGVTHGMMVVSHLQFLGENTTQFFSWVQLMGPVGRGGLQPECKWEQETNPPRCWGLSGLGGEGEGRSDVLGGFNPKWYLSWAGRPCGEGFRLLVVQVLLSQAMLSALGSCS